MNLSSLNKETCSQCFLSKLCFPLGLSNDELQILESIIDKKKIFKKHEYIFHQNDGLNFLYAIRSGAVKSFVQHHDGKEQIIQFYFPGEILGLDAIANEKHVYDVMALEETIVCQIDYKNIFEIATKIPALQKYLLQLMSRQMINETMYAHNFSADQRVAIFLLNLQERILRFNTSEKHLELKMKREDIANFLGLAAETISRIFTKFIQEKVIISEQKRIEIIGQKKLEDIAKGLILL